jgi:hypothetical protein
MLPLLLTVALAEVPDRHGAPPSCPPRVTQLTLPDGLESTDPRLLDEHLVVVRKADRQVMRFRDGMLLDTPDGPACWWAGLAATDDPSVWTGTKLRQGDLHTPEGFYRTSDKPWSSFYGAIAVHYPDVADAEGGMARGLVGPGTVARVRDALSRDAKPPQNTRLGGEILLHGGGGRYDWTLGCVALDDDDLDALRATLPEGMRTWVLILP